MLVLNLNLSLDCLSVSLCDLGEKGMKCFGVHTRFYSCGQKNPRRTLKCKSKVLGEVLALNSNSLLFCKRQKFETQIYGQFLLTFFPSLTLL